jgi:hypothetical protein
MLRIGGVNSGSQKRFLSIPDPGSRDSRIPEPDPAKNLSILIQKIVSKLKEI